MNPYFPNCWRLRRWRLRAQRDERAGARLLARQDVPCPTARARCNSSRLRPRRSAVWTTAAAAMFRRQRRRGARPSSRAAAAWRL